MSTLNLYPNENATFADKVNGLQNGDTLLVHHGVYPVTPKPPEQFPESPLGAACAIKGKEDIRIVGFGNPIVQLTEHGDGLLIDGCKNVNVEGVTFQGAGVIRRPENKISYAMIQLYRDNARLAVKDCCFFDSGNHGIAQLWGPRGTSQSIFEGNVFARGGNYGRESLVADGAALAVGGNRNVFRNNHITDWLRGIEIENPFPASGSEHCVIERNLIERCTWQSILVTPDGVPADRMFEQFRGIQICNNTIVGTTVRSEAISNCGIYVSGGLGFRIQDNHISRIADGIGILLQSDHGDIRDSLIAGNMIEDTDRTGIQFSTGVGGSVSQNVFHGNILRRIKGRGIAGEGTLNLVSLNQVFGCDYEPYYGLKKKQTTQWISNEWNDCKLWPNYG